MIFSRIAYPLLIPTLLLALAIWLRPTIALIPDPFLNLLNYLPYVLLMITTLLCLQFNQVRSLLVAIIIGFSNLVIQIYLQDSIQESSPLIIFFLLSTLLPLLLASISWFPERGVITPHSLILLLLISLPVLLAVYLYHNPNLLTSSLELYNVRGWEFSVLPPVAFTIYIILFFHQLLRLWLLQQPFDSTISVILAALMVNFIFFDKPLMSMTVFSTIQLILIWTVLKQSHDMAYRDELTGLAGRRALNEALKSPGRKYVLAMVDIDHFKKFNDKYGHDIGDDVLKVVANKIAQVTGGGRAFRYGGEEFTVLFKGKELASCIPHLEAVREEIAQYAMLIRETSKRPKTRKEGKILRGKRKKTRPVKVTISIGVANKPQQFTSPEMVLIAADKALYKAKKAGRNCLSSAK